MRNKTAILALTLGIIFVLSGCSNYKFKASTNYEVDSFTVTDHRGATITKEDLLGEPWIAMFVFTNCVTVCSPMTYNMAEIQQRLVDKGIDSYKIVGFSVDPENDTPEVMNTYLERHTVPDESKWHYVTEYEQSFIEQFAADSFKAFVKKVDGEDQVTHGVRFYLVDEKGINVKNYVGYDEEGVKMDNIVVDLKTLIEERLQ